MTNGTYERTALGQLPPGPLPATTVREQMMQRDAAVAQAMRTLEALATGVATSFAKLTDLTHPHARTAPLAPSSTLAPELYSSFGVAAEIDRVCDQLRLLQAAVDRVRRRAARRSAKAPKTAAAIPLTLLVERSVQGPDGRRAAAKEAMTRHV